MEFFIADTHFHHENVIKFDKRPFASLEEMNQVLIKNWNSVIQPNDHIYILGDFCWKTAQDEAYKELIKILHGHKHLIKGNHDPLKWTMTYSKYFESIDDYKEIKVNGYHLILSHYPLLCFKADYNDNCWMLHGHVHITQENDFIQQWTRQLVKREHNPGENRGQIMNVGCMMPWMKYTPQPLDTIIDAWKKLYIEGEDGDDFDE